MIEKAQHILQTVFGYDSFRGLQQDVIERVTGGGDALVLMPTGGGKSLCFQIPALVFEGLAVVVSPLIALMQDQVDALREVGVDAAFLNSTLAYDEALAIEDQALSGELDLLYVAPERLMQERTLSLLTQCRLSLFAIDEAHCVSQWGHDFRPEYLKLSMLHEVFPHVPRIALTATADERTRKEILQRLQLDREGLFVSGFDRPNIRYQIGLKKSPKKQLLSFLQSEHPGDAGIVYCLSRKRVEDTAAWLSGQGFTALPYHAGLPNDLRQYHQDRFLKDDSVIIVATIAFGMGIDKPDVRFVAHLDLPKSVEAYYQETGRAGRDGEPADAWMVYGLQDVVMLRQMLESGEADEQHKRIERQKLDAMLGLCEIATCRRNHLLHYFGEDHSEPCGNCDTCLAPVDTWDGTVPLQKALSCVYRTGQRFGVTYLIDVLLGKEEERILQNGHDRISTFGIGKDLGAGEWRSLFRQAVALGYVQVDVEGYGGLHLSEKAKPVLSGEETVALRRDPTPAKTKKKKTSRKRGSYGATLDESPMASHEEELYSRLCELRRELAQKQNIPAYRIFPNATLKHMVRLRPTTKDELIAVSGVGERKLFAYGEAFLAAINE